MASKKASRKLTRGKKLKKGKKLKGTKTLGLAKYFKCIT